MLKVQLLPAAKAVYNDNLTSLTGGVAQRTERGLSDTRLVDSLACESDERCRPLTEWALRDLSGEVEFQRELTVITGTSKYPTISVELSLFLNFGELLVITV